MELTFPPCLPLFLVFILRESHYAALADLKLELYPPASAHRELELQAHTTFLKGGVV